MLKQILNIPVSIIVEAGTKSTQDYVISVDSKERQTEIKEKKF